MTFSKMTVINGVLPAALLFGCAAPTTSPAPAAGHLFSGEVWTWDEPRRIVTLRQLDGRTIRVKVIAAELARLRLHQHVTLRGELAPPAEIEVVRLPAPPVTAIPMGPAVSTELVGTVVGLDPKGVVFVASPHGRLSVWTAVPTAGRLASGAKVRVRMSLQPVRLVPRTAAGVEPAPAPGREPTVTLGDEPGDYAVVVGRVLGTGPDGRIFVDSPRGPVAVWVPEASRDRISDAVRVRTSVHPGG